MFSGTNRSHPVWVKNLLSNPYMLKTEHWSSSYTAETKQTRNLKKREKRKNNQTDSSYNSLKIKLSCIIPHITPNTAAALHWPLPSNKGVGVVNSNSEARDGRGKSLYGGGCICAG